MASSGTDVGESSLLSLRTIRIGLLGASKIALPAIIEPARSFGRAAVTRVAARSADRAGAYAREHGIPGIEPDYGALVASDAVDVVYNALPPSGHERWSTAALRNGKHVLCEKPFAMNALAAERMVAAADASAGTLLEAFHYRFHPLFSRVLDTVDTGVLGDIRELEAQFNVPIPYRPGELRHMPELGGGACMDLGCYPLHWVRTVMRAEPTVVSATAVQERYGIDISMRAWLDFDGVGAGISCSMAADLAPTVDAALRIQGTRGRLVAINPVAPHMHNELIIEVRGETRREKIYGNTTYWYQLQHVVEVLDGKAEPLTGGADAVANMRAIDSIYAAAGMAPRGKER